MTDVASDEPPAARSRPGGLHDSAAQPVKYAMAAMGLLEELYRLPMVSPKAESKEKINSVLKDLGLLKAALV